MVGVMKQTNYASYETKFPEKERIPGTNFFLLNLATFFV